MALRQRHSKSKMTLRVLPSTDIFTSQRGANACCGTPDGGDEEDRTPDLRIANATLSQLSYVPTARIKF